MTEGHEAPCYYCEKPCDALTGNPNLWPIPLCHADEPGKVKWHHIGCVSMRCKAYDEATAIQGDTEVLKYVTSGNAVPVTRCTVSADLIRQLVNGRSLSVPAEGRAWLVEVNIGWGTGNYWNGGADGAWTVWGTIDRAVRFSRKEDAEKIIKTLVASARRHEKANLYIATEHEWLDASPKP